MLGFVVALGFGVIALMGLYATGLLTSDRGRHRFWKGQSTLAGPGNRQIYMPPIFPRGCPQPRIYMRHCTIT